MQTTACYRVAHIRAELPVNSTGIYIGAAGPVTERIDLGLRICLVQVIGLGVTLADDQAGLVQNVFAVTAVDGIDLFILNVTGSMQLNDDCNSNGKTKQSYDAEQVRTHKHAHQRYQWIKSDLFSNNAWFQCLPDHGNDGI